MDSREFKEAVYIKRSGIRSTQQGRGIEWLSDISWFEKLEDSDAIH